MTPTRSRHKDQIPLRSLYAFNLMSRSAFELHHVLCPFHQIIYKMCSAYTEDCLKPEWRPNLHSSPFNTHTTFTFEEHSCSGWLSSPCYCFLDTHIICHAHVLWKSRSISILKMFFGAIWTVWRNKQHSGRHLSTPHNYCWKINTP